MNNLLSNIHHNQLFEIYIHSASITVFVLCHIQTERGLVCGVAPSLYNDVCMSATILVFIQMSSSVLTNHVASAVLDSHSAPSTVTHQIWRDNSLYGNVVSLYMEESRSARIDLFTICIYFIQYIKT